MKIFMAHADIWDVMPSFALWFVAVILAFILAATALICPATPEEGDYHATVRLISGLVAMAGALYFGRAIDLTLLRSGGTIAFRAAYVTAAALGGLGLAEAVSVFRPANIGYALAAYAVVSVASGLLWVRFYGRAA
jgi:hypothetical protein